MMASPSPPQPGNPDTAGTHMASFCGFAEGTTVMTIADTHPNEPKVSYHLNDFVYLETSKSDPFEIGQIDSIVQKRSGAIELHVRTLLRRLDVPIVMILSTEREYNLAEIKSNSDALHELYYNSTSPKSFAPSQLRGKCLVVRFEPDIDNISDFGNQEDIFFYRLKYNYTTISNGGNGNGNGNSNGNNCAAQQPYLYPLEVGSMRVGAEYQAVVPMYTLTEEEKGDHYKDHAPETLRYTPNHRLTDYEIDTYITLCRSTGTLGRTQIFFYAQLEEEECKAEDGSNPLLRPPPPPPNALQLASSASRDFTTECAMDILHSCNYDLLAATRKTALNGMPAICMESAEKWTKEEVELFTEGFEKVGKNFRALRQQFLPGKDLSSIVTFYYKWKKCGRFIRNKKSQSSPQTSLPSPSAKSPAHSNGGGGNGNGNGRVLYNKTSNTKAGDNILNRPRGSGGHGKRKLKAIAIPERFHNTDSHALTPEKSRRCASCLVTTLCQNYPCGMLVYALCRQCRTHWQRMGAFRIIGTS